MNVPRSAVNPRLVWAGFFIVAVIWGSSFLLIRIGTQQLSPFQLVFIRTTVAAIGLNGVLALRGQHLPLTGRTLLQLAFVGVLSTTLPFALITWGEQRIESGLASVLNATTALFTLVIAHFVFTDERITPMKALGLIVGFLGVVVLFSRSLTGEGVLTSSLVSMLAVVVASLFYGISGTYSRKMMKGQIEPTTLAAGVMLFGSLTSGLLMVLAPLFGGQAAVPVADMRPDVVLSVAILGLLNTFVAYLIHYWVVKELGAAKASMVTYVSPVIALLLGWLILNELVDWRLLLGAAMIFSAIGLVNLRIRTRRPLDAAVPVKAA